MNAVLREKFRKELDAERNELFFAKRVLFVEGDTEKLALPEFAAKWGADLDKLGVTIVEVGGKKSLKALAEVAISFDIPTGILFDRDSRDFKKERDKEEACNKELFELAPAESPHAVWMMEKDYEAVVRSATGEELYQTLCETYSTPSKPIKGRLIAADPRTSVPPLIETVLCWAAGDLRSPA
jgi:predicted ATP-dependent endonuclease of OLD family